MTDRELLENFVTSALEQVTEVLTAETATSNGQPAFTPAMVQEALQEAMSLKAASAGSGAEPSTWKLLRSAEGMIHSAIGDLKYAQILLQRVIEREGF